MTEIWDKYREVHHYTSAGGLQGILGSQTLFATHYNYLNDWSELTILRKALPGLLESTVKECVLEHWRESSAGKRQIRELGGVPTASRDIAGKLASIHFDAAFAETGDNPAMAIPYITSFCGHTNEDSYERKHGLLSQWRAYGTEGGVALVFDTERLWQLCLKEVEAYSYAMITFEDVVYHQVDDDAFSREFGPTIKLIE